MCEGLVIIVRRRQNLMEIGECLIAGDDSIRLVSIGSSCGPAP